MSARLFALACVTLASCSICHRGPKVDPSLGSALTKLTAAVEVTVRYESPPAGLSDAELLALATKHDPSLLEPFRKGRLVRVLRIDRDVVLLVCTDDGRHGLAEDAGCTAPLEHNWAFEGVDVPCEFSPDAASSCAAPAAPPPGAGASPSS